MNKRSFWFLLGFCLVAMLLPALASGLSPMLTCDPQSDVVQYNIFVDGTKVATSEAVVDTESGLYYLWFNLRTLGLADGSYVATATAENLWEESGLSNPCPFDKATPANPLGLRVSGE